MDFEVPQTLLSALRAGNVVVSVGAGFTRPCGFPGFEGFLRGLVSRCGLAETPGCGVPDEDQAASYTDLDGLQFRIVKASGKERACAAMRDMLQIGELPAAMERSLAALFNLPVAAVMTWNWDEVLERRCRLLPCGEAGYEELLASHASIGMRPPLLKLQGCLEDSSTVVVAEDDYARVAPTRNAFLKRVYNDKCVLHVGLGFRGGGCFPFKSSGSGRHFAILADVTEERRQVLLAEQDVVPLCYDSAEGHVEGICRVLERIALDALTVGQALVVDPNLGTSEEPPTKKQRSEHNGGSPRSASRLRAIYVTSNEGKHGEAQHVVRLLRGDQVSLERISVDLPELQGTPEEISRAKTREAAMILKDTDVRFIITDDGGLELNCLNGFPGVYIKPMMHCLEDTGLGALVHHYENHSAVATCTLGIIDRENPAEVRTFRGELRGSIIAVPRGAVKHGRFSWNTVFVPDGYDQTVGELALEEHATMSHRRQAFKAWLDTVLPALDA